MRNLKKKGFTIVELVIVIAVIAVLAAVLIPTFSNLIKKANESVDIQLVRNMNVILEQDEALNGKPADTDKVKEILAKNGIVNPAPALAESAFAWDSEENLIVLLNKETQKGVFPKEYKDVYFKLTWKMLAGTVNVSMDSLGADLNQALQNVELGQTIVLSSNQTLNVDLLPKNIDIDLAGNTLTLPNGLPMQANGNVTLSNGNVNSTQITTANGANLVLKNINLTSTAGRILFPTTASQIDIIGGSIIGKVLIDTNYSDNTSKSVIVNIKDAVLGSQEEPCLIGVSLITSGDVTISNSTIYATNRCVYNRAGNVTIKNSTLNYLRTEDFNDTYLPETTNSYGYTPKGARNFAWGSSYDGIPAPIVVGDFYAQHYSFDANCTLENVIFNKTNNTYPDVYISQENYDVVPVKNNLPDVENLSHNNLNPKVLTKEVVKSNLTCDNSVHWVVNPGDNSAFKDYATGELAIYANYSGFQFSNSGYGGVALLYVDNVFVNGVEQAPGSTSSNPIPAN